MYFIALTDLSLKQSLLDLVLARPTQFSDGLRREERQVLGEVPLPAFEIFQVMQTAGVTALTIYY